jgi:glycosyltransferase involved in cell wall biosynthesis
MKVAVVIPAFNEEKYICTVLRAVLPYHLPVVVVDDGSADHTAQMARRELTASAGAVLVHESNLGKGAALRTGCDYAFQTLGADAVIFLDADNQHDPVEIARFIKALEKGAQLVFGVRQMGSDMPLMRFLGNKIASVWLNILFYGYVADIPSGYKAMTRSAYEKVRWSATGYEVEMEIAARTLKNRIPYESIEIRTIYHDKDKGMTLLDGLAIAGKLLQWRLRL